jgi:hypothetical protein
MTAKRRKWDMRTIIYILIAAMLVLSVVYVVLLPSTPQPKIFTVREILDNSGNYINDSIIVEGTYYSTYEGLGPPTLDDQVTPGVNLLDLDLETNNISLNDGTKYRVTGVLREIDSPQPGSVVQLVAESAKRA